MSLSADERAKLAARVRALRAKTVENGCTEDEAIAAAEKVAEILERYNMTLDEAEIRESPFSRAKRDVRDDMVGAKLYVVANGIEILTGARYWTTRHVEGVVEIHFFGFEHEVEVADYLMAVCAGAMRRAAREAAPGFMLLRQPIRHQRLASFIDGMAARLCDRLIRMKPKAPTGRGLIVLKKDLIDQGLKDIGINLEKNHQHRSRIDLAAYRAGQLAGDRVGLNAGLRGSGGQPQKLIN